jgi:hypothetical protein
LSNNLKHRRWRIKPYVPLLVLLIMAITVPSVRSQQAGTIQVEPTPVTITTVGSNTTVQVNVSSVQNLYGVDIGLYWDRNILNCTGVTYQGAGSIVTSLGLTSAMYSQYDSINNAYNATNGQLLFSLAFLYQDIISKYKPPHSFNGTGTVAWLNFTGTGTGVTSLTFDPSAPTDWISINMSTSPPSLSSITYSTYGSGQITVLPEFSAVGAVSLLLVGTLAATVLTKTVRSKKHKDVAS